MKQGDWKYEDRLEDREILAALRKDLERHAMTARRG